MSNRKHNCPACAAEKNGIKSRRAFIHTCNQQVQQVNKEIAAYVLDKNQSNKDYNRDLFLARHFSKKQPETNTATNTPLRDGGQTIYIAGKVTGLPYKEVWKKFDDAQWLLEGRGWKVINPCLLCNETTEWQHALRTCIAALTTVNAIYLLPDWKDSRGASIEVFLAGQLGLKIIHHNEIQ